MSPPIPPPATSTLSAFAVDPIAAMLIQGQKLATSQRCGMKGDLCQISFSSERSNTRVVASFPVGEVRLAPRAATASQV